MKKILLLSLLSFLFIPSVNAYYSPGNPTGFVNDFAGMMNDKEKQLLENKLSQFEKESSNEISVVTVNSLGEDTIENFAVKLFEEWKIGKEKNDNGVLILVSKEDRKMRIEVGYGLEPSLTDAISSQIINNVMKPAFQNNEYFLGIGGAVDRIISVTKGEYVPSENSSGSKGKSFSFGEWFWLLFFIPIWLSSILARSKSWWLGGVFGGVISLILIFIFSLAIGLIAMLFLIPLGLLFDYIVSSQYQKGKSSGHVPWWIGGGNGGIGGSSGSSGGFGGFGGGSSGGGGASGDW